MRIDINFNLHIDVPPPVLAALDGLSRKLDLILDRQDSLMIDTSKMIAAIADEHTETTSLIALATQQNAAMKDLSTQLAAAIAANDPAALAQVQADLDKAVADLSLDNQATKDAIAANTPAATP